MKAIAKDLFIYLFIADLGNYLIVRLILYQEKIMGAWGTGIFENDMSCDLIYEAMATKAQTFITRGIDVINREYLDADEAYEIIVAGAILDMILNGTKYQHHAEGFDTWLTQQDPKSVRKFKLDLVKGLQVILSDISELNELWGENESDYPVWKSTIVNLMDNISDR